MWSGLLTPSTCSALCTRRSWCRPGPSRSQIGPARLMKELQVSHSRETVQGIYLCDEVSQLPVDTTEASGGSSQDLLEMFLKRRSGRWDGDAKLKVREEGQSSVPDRDNNSSVGDRPVSPGNLSLGANLMHLPRQSISVDNESSPELGRLTQEIVGVAKSLPHNASLESLLMPFHGRITTRDGNLVLRALGEEHLIWPLLSFFQWMRVNDPCLLNSRSFCTLFMYLGKQRMVDKALVYYKNMPEDCNFHCVQVYNSLLGALARSNRPEMMPTILQEMEDRNIDRDIVTCSILITASKAEGKERVEKVWSIYDDMLRDGVQPNTVFYGSLIKAFCDEGHLKSALLVSILMDKMGIPLNVIICNTLIDAHCKALQFEEAEGVLKEMKDSGLRPSETTYNVLINGYGRNSQIEVAEELVSEMQREGLKPDVFTYTSLISAYGKQKMSEKAVNVFLRMRKNGLVPTSHTYTALINAYAEGGWHEKAQRAFDNMRREKLKPTIETYTALLDGYRRAGDLDMVRHVWKTIKEDGCEVTRVTYRTTMDAFAKHGLYIDARDVMEEFRKRGLEPDTMIFNMLLNAYARGGVSTKLPKLLLEMQAVNCKPDSFTYCTLIYACLRLRDFTNAFRYDQIMKEKRLLPDPKTYRKMRSILDAKYAQKLENDKRADSGHNGDALQEKSHKNPQKAKRHFKRYMTEGPPRGTERTKALWKMRATLDAKRGQKVEHDEKADSGYDTDALRKINCKNPKQPKLHFPHNQKTRPAPGSERAKALWKQREV